MEKSSGVSNGHFEFGLQLIGLLQKQIKERFKCTFSKCGNMKQLRTAAEREPELVDTVLDSMSPMNIVISDIASPFKPLRQVF